jgi:hypothetical protein
MLSGLIGLNNLPSGKNTENLMLSLGLNFIVCVIAQLPNRTKGESAGATKSVTGIINMAMEAFGLFE